MHILCHVSYGHFDMLVRRVRGLALFALSRFLATRSSLNVQIFAMRIATVTAAVAPPRARA